MIEDSTHCWWDVRMYVFLTVVPFYVKSYSVVGSVSWTEKRIKIVLDL